MRRAVLALRRRKGMVLDGDDHDTWSAGSFFTNPIVSENFARTLPADAPRWPTAPAEPDVVLAVERAGDLDLMPAGATGRTDYEVKLSAAWLIEHAGVRRGFQLPGSRAAVSSRHTLALTNRGGATAEQIAELARFIVSRVQAEYGIVLRPEPVLVGVEV